MMQDSRDTFRSTLAFPFLLPILMVALGFDGIVVTAIRESFNAES